MELKDKLEGLRIKRDLPKRDLLHVSQNAFGAWLNENGIRFEPGKLEDLTGKIFFIDNQGFSLQISSLSSARTYYRRRQSTNHCSFQAQSP